MCERQQWYVLPPLFLKPVLTSNCTGTLLCCNSVINGDMPLVVELSELVGNFRLNPNSINGLYCTENPFPTSPIPSPKTSNTS
jgi:hypothetical protein